MARARAAKADLDSRTFLDGAIYLYRRKNSTRGKWDIRLKVHGHTRIIVTAESDYAAKLIGETQFGAGNVLHYTRAS